MLKEKNSSLQRAFWSFRKVTSCFKQPEDSSSRENAELRMDALLKGSMPFSQNTLCL